MLADIQEDSITMRETTDEAIAWGKNKRTSFWGEVTKLYEARLCNKNSDKFADFSVGVILYKSYKTRCKLAVVLSVQKGSKLVPKCFLFILFYFFLSRFQIGAFVMGLNHAKVFGFENLYFSGKCFFRWGEK